MKNIDLSHLVGKDVSVAFKEAQELFEKTRPVESEEPTTPTTNTTNRRNRIRNRGR